MNKGKSERRTATRTQEIIEAVCQALERNQGRITARKNGLAISPSLFCQRINKDFSWYPYKMIRCHNLKYGDYERSSLFVSGFCISVTIKDSWQTFSLVMKLELL